MKPILTTERLILREFIEEDHPFIIQLVNSEGWLQNIGNRNITEKDQAINYIKISLRGSYEKNGYGLYLVKLKHDQVPIGMCGFVKRDSLQHPDLGFAFLPQHTGSGYAFESSMGVLNFGFAELKFEKIAAITIPTNQRSVHLLNKLGFQHEKGILINNEEVMLFGLICT